MLLDPSPKFHSQLVGDPVDWSVKFTVNAAVVGPVRLNVKVPVPCPLPGSPAVASVATTVTTACILAAADIRHYEKLNSEKAALAAKGWLRQQALAHFQQRIEHFRTHFTLQSVSIRLSNARSRWGSCHTSGRISLNWRLIHLPSHLIDYVVVHELAHLVEMNHSPRFWAVVARVIPDYAARRREIRKESHRYVAD